VEGKSSRINEFKEFVREHPKLIEDVRKNNRSWKETYEDWVILGEDHEIWDHYRSKSGKKSETGTRKKGRQDETLKSILSLLKNVDLNQVNQYASQFNGALTNVQELVQQFQKSKTPQQPSHYPYNYGQPYPYRND
jgi:hypothetical protein